MNKVVKKRVSLLLATLFIILFGIIINGNSSNNSTNNFSKVASLGNNLFASSINSYSIKNSISHFDVEPQSAVTYTKAINETGAQVVGANANVSAIRSIDKTSNQIQYSEDGGTSWKTVSVSYDNRESEWQTDHNLNLNTANLVVEFQIQIDESWYTVKLDKDTVYPANTYVISSVQNAGRLSQLGAKQISYAGSTYYDISGISVFKASNITCPDQRGIDLILSIATILTNQEVNVNVEKTWEGTIPNIAEVTLKLVGVTSSGETFDLSNDYTVTLNQNNNWKHTFTKVSTTSKTGNYILDKFTVEETKVIVNGTDVTEEYKTTITQKDKEQTTQTTNINGTLTTTTIDLYGINIKNTYTPRTTSVTINKIWNDNDNQDGLRNSYKVKLTGIVDNKEVYSDEQELSKDTLTYTWSNILKYYNGKLITYSVDETSVPKGYTKSIDGYNITNTHTPITINLPIEKVWLDGNNQDGIRPEEITVNLIADGEKIDTVTITANKEGKWLHTFTKLPKYNNGKEIKYTFSEEAVEGYEVSYKGNIIENTHNPSEKSITVNKVWNDSNNNDGIRPNQIEVKLIGKVGNDEVYSATAIIKEEENWTYTFDKLPEYNNGSIISYTLEETLIEGYTTNIEESEKTFTITNTHEKEQVIISGEKTWDDNDNQDGKRPTTITINLLANGVVVETKEVSADSNGNWTYTFTKDKYQDKEEIKYTLEEVSVEGYTTIIEEGSYNITNYHKPETLTYTINKEWLDDEDNDGIRPDSINVSLLANGEIIQKVVISKENNWTYTFENLPRYANGKVIEYTIIEDELKGYTPSIDYGEYDEDNNSITTDIKNNHEKEKIDDIIIKKIWNDSNSEERPDSIEVIIYANGEYYTTITLSSENNWTYTLTNLDKYKNGVLINYTIEEVSVPGYETSYDGYTIINNIIIPAKGGDVEELPPQTGIDNITYGNKNGSSEVIMFILLGLLGIKALKRNY